jgi:hypothetical protein
LVISLLDGSHDSIIYAMGKARRMPAAIKNYCGATVLPRSQLTACRAASMLAAGKRPAK